MGQRVGRGARVFNRKAGKSLKNTWRGAWRKKSQSGNGTVTSKVSFIRDPRHKLNKSIRRETLSQRSVRQLVSSEGRARISGALLLCRLSGPIAKNLARPWPCIGQARKSRECLDKRPQGRLGKGGGGAALCAGPGPERPGKRVRSGTRRGRQASAGHSPTNDSRPGLGSATVQGSALGEGAATPLV
jgi:hypothetical protein